MSREKELNELGRRIHGFLIESFPLIKFEKAKDNAGLSQYMFAIDGYFEASESVKEQLIREVMLSMKDCFTAHFRGDRFMGDAADRRIEKKKEGDTVYFLGERPFELMEYATMESPSVRIACLGQLK